MGERVRVRLEDESCGFGGKVTRDCSGARGGEDCGSGMGDAGGTDNCGSVMRGFVMGCKAVW